MVSRKRGRDEMEAEEPKGEPSTLRKLRSMWQFANLMQYINLFGDAIKFDNDFDINDLETECLKPEPSEKLAQLGLALLKHVSSHKGLTLSIFDEYTRRQYVAKAPNRNPFGTDENPRSFNDFDIFTKVRVLQQLSVWTLNNPNSIRERLALAENEQTQWRMEPLGWDAEGRELFVLDDDRLYRRTQPPPPPQPTKSKTKSKRKSKSTRSNKRRKTYTVEPEEESEEDTEVHAREDDVVEDDGFGGMKWECVCVTLEEYQDFIESLKRTRDADEKILRDRLVRDVLPVIEKAADEQAKKEARRQKEWEVMQKLATAKRSSRISSRLEKQKEADEAAEAERRRQDEVAMANAEEQKRRNLEEARESRMMTREQRLKERETKRILHEEELRKLKEDSEKVEQNAARLSERHLKAEMKRRHEELEKLSKQEDEWLFDCEVCGVYGENYNDDTPFVACDRCGIWQHQKCHGITEAQAAQKDFPFVCGTCRRKEEEAKQPKLPPLKLRLTSASPASDRYHAPQLNGTSSIPPPRQLEAVSIPVQRPISQQPTHPVQHTQNWMDGPSLSPRGQALGPPGIQRSEAAYGSPFNKVNGSSPPAFTRPSSSGHNIGAGSATNGFLASSPPQYQSPRPPTSSFYNGNAFNTPHTHASATNPPYGSSFNRPSSATSTGAPYHSPIKHSPAPSPQPKNGVSAHVLINSPHSSFPPTASTTQPSFSPVKHSSPAPSLAVHMSSPAPTPQMAPSSSQLPAQMLPHPIPAPEKHDAIRPVSSHSLSETPILPPVKSLSPSATSQILNPPTKKASPTPDRLHFPSVNGHAMNGGQQ